MQKENNAGKTDEEQILLCVGLGFGRALKIGAGVNAASKLGEDRADAREILVTGSVQERSSRFPELNIRFGELDEAPPGADSAYRVPYDL